jgi:hypothetical protein
MKIVGLLLTVAGWLIPVASLTMTNSLGVRMVLCFLGMGACLVGILGFINGSYLKQAIWKK